MRIFGGSVKRVICENGEKKFDNESECQTKWEK